MTPKDPPLTEVVMKTMTGLAIVIALRPDDHVGVTVAVDVTRAGH